MMKTDIELIGIDIGYVIIAFVVILLLQFIWILTLIAKFRRLDKRLSKFTKGKTADNLEQVMAKNFSHIRSVVNNEKKQNKEIKNIYTKFHTTYSKIGLVKYDAFKEMSGHLSFALALLTDSNDGIILSCMHSREGCFTYCKEIKDMESYYILSEEERLALNVALGDKTAIERARAMMEIEN